MRKAVEQEQVDAVRGQGWARDGRQRETTVKGRWRGESPTPRREEQRWRSLEGRGQDWGVVKWEDTDTEHGKADAPVETGIGERGWADNRKERGNEGPKELNAGKGIEQGTCCVLELPRAVKHTNRK